jgi:maltooligosyltrehalose trehalohydrolase
MAEVRVWAPRARDVAVRAHGEDHPLADAGMGVREGVLALGHGDRYAFVLDGGDPLPDPASRWQPDGLRGPSALLDPAAFGWTDDGWPGLDLDHLVLYELHVGTFSPEGTFEGVIPHLAQLRELGVTAIELMPIGEFPGARGWGYDGVYVSAAQSSYGGPSGLQRLVDAAHREGLGVVLDVVYNHVGASGTQALAAFAPYFTDAYETFWGAAINYDGEDADGVREWVMQSAEGWVRDLHVDGFRLDAIHAIYDRSARPILAELAERVQRHGALVISESALNDPRVIRPRDRGGHGHDAQWADDFHHALRVLLTGEREGYYADFGRVADLARCYRRPFLHDGTYSPYRRRRFGAPAGDRPPQQFVVFSQNHDQVGNRALGDRLPPVVRPLAAFATLLSPFTPMLFQGEEHAEPAPFQFFTDHIDPEIAEATREGRRREFAAFAGFAEEDVPDPQDPATFARSKLTRDGDPALSDLYAKLLRARRALPPGDADAIQYDEQARWLRVLRGPYELALSFADRAARVPCRGAEVVLATHADTHVHGGEVALPPLAGALLR